MRCISVKIVILTVLFFMQSCIREDTSDCITSALRLSFRYTLNNQNSDLFGSEVHQVAAYIFDAEGKYIGSYLETGDKLISKYIMTIPLPEGSYQVIVFCDNLNTFSAGWVDRETNLFYGELQPEITTVADFRVMLKNKEGTDGYLVPESVPGDLYAGYITNALSTYNVSDITNVNLMKDTKNIKIKISGLNSLTRSTIIPEVYVTAKNGRYKSDNSIDTLHRALKYIPHSTSVTNDTINSELKTMRLMAGHKPMLVIKHPVTSGYLFNQDITELILSNPKYASQEDIDREDSFVFEVNFNREDNDLVISVSINGWEVNTVVPVDD